MLDTKIFVQADIENDAVFMAIEDDTESNAVAVALTLEEAWELVTQLSRTIQKLRPITVAPKPTKRPKKPVESPPKPAIAGGVKGAVIQAIGADQVRRERNMRPGSPSNLPIKSLNTRYEVAT